MKTRNVTVIGLQWGDEGKGKVVDALARVCKYVVRYCGGANAGHTVSVAGERFALHLIPCGILHRGVVNVVGNGVAFDPGVALGEIKALQERGVSVGPKNLRISAAANVVMPYHKLQDSLSEAALGADKIGTTARGIGPCYADKAHRTTAIRVGELADPAALREKIKRIVEMKNKFMTALYDAEPLDADEIAVEYADYGRRLEPMICDTGDLLRRAIAAGRRVLFEGGQGSMLDIDHGTYPFVTSSSVSACGVPAGAGVPPSEVGDVLGVMKAYTSRVGSGPFPTEQSNQIGDYLRERGREYGTTTGRPRRCGWLDSPAVRYAADLSGVTEMVMSLLDVLTGLEELKICTRYKLGGKRLEGFSPSLMTGVECVYETLPGWKDDLGDCRGFRDLPASARGYVRRVEELIGRRIGLISVGADRRKVIVRNSRIKGLAQCRSFRPKA
jgi:adenylosuccinate synthase